MQKKSNLRSSSLLLSSSVKALVIMALALFASCSGTKFLKEGESLYTGATINFDTRGRRVPRKQAIEEELQTLITPKPNSKFLGMRIGLWFYYVAGEPKKEKGFRNFIRKKLGQPPVLIKDVAPERIAKVLSGQLNNDGYFKSTVQAEVKTRKKESHVYYNVVLMRPYRLDSIRYPQPKDSVYASILSNLQEKSLLRPRQRYDLERMQAEQERIEEVLENQGFYYFDDRYLIFEADSTIGKRKVDLRLRLEKGIPTNAKRIYRFNNVNIFPNYTLTRDTLSALADTTVINGFNYIDTRHNFRPEVITRVINIKKGDIYSREAQQLTLSHLMGLGVFKFVNIKFAEVNTDSSLLNANIYLTPLPKKSLRAETQVASKSNNFAGPGISGSFTNRNFLRGAELFQLKLNVSYEFQISRQNQGPLSSFETGLESSLTIPRFISPIRIDYNSKKYLPKTVIKAGFNFQNRVNYYRLNSFNMGYGYIWRETADKSHELYIADISYVRTDKKSPEFDTLLTENPVLANSFENQFIIGTRYSYTINTQLRTDPMDVYEKRKYRTHNFYFNGGVDIAGNLLHLAQNIADRSGEGPYELFGQPYSQFVKGDVDFRHYWQFDDHNKLVSRIIVGAGYPYKNSSTLPYIKQFSIGGSNSIRAFQARSVGPGTYNVRTDNPQEKTLFVDQRADLKLEGNVEYRFDIFKALKGALFVDAGNIWLLKEDSTRAGGQFHPNTFLNQLAVGTGFGLRFDFSFFVLRLDTAFPIRKPYQEGNEWVFDEIDFGSRTWRQQNLIFNIAIGYPF
ncbi:MAG TPA: BamA/TamA family outer membrane protein [Chryseolinea sp.]|nr:BamA/TamA family outer membrane protein [Chryseolinea sp.]